MGTLRFKLVTNTVDSGIYITIKRRDCNDFLAAVPRRVLHTLSGLKLMFEYSFEFCG